VIRTERFTTRATEAIAAAQQLAEGEGHAELNALHLLLSLVDQPDGVVPAVIERIGKDPAAVASAAREELAKLPRVTGTTQLTLGADARRILSDAHPVAERMRDEYVST
jgi:ATP-dependent Clp protease ATP-binding subunit ClpB